MTRQPSFCVGNIHQVLDTRLPVWIKVCQNGVSQKSKLYITTTPHTKQWNIG